MIVNYILYSISITMTSWIVGMIVTGVLRKKEYYKNLSNLNLIKSKTLNSRIGIGSFKWIVKNTFFKYLNISLKLKNKIEMTDLNRLRKDMTFAEISHLIGFGFVTIFVLVKLINGNYLFVLILMIVNIILNLYPSLLQQENKRRIDRFIRDFQQEEKETKITFGSN